MRRKTSQSEEVKPIRRPLLRGVPRNTNFYFRLLIFCDMKGLQNKLPTQIWVLPLIGACFGLGLSNCRHLKRPWLYYRAGQNKEGASGWVENNVIECWASLLFARLTHLILLSCAWLNEKRQDSSWCWKLGWVATPVSRTIVRLSHSTWVSCPFDSFISALQQFRWRIFMSELCHLTNCFLTCSWSKKFQSLKNDY